MLHQYSESIKESAIRSSPRGEMARIWGWVSGAPGGPALFLRTQVARAAHISAFAPGLVWTTAHSPATAAIPVPRLVSPPEGEGCQCSAPGPASSCILNPSSPMHYSLPAALAPHRHQSLGQVGTDCVQKGAFQKAGLWALPASPLLGSAISVPRCGHVWSCCHAVEALTFWTAHLDS